MPHEASPTNQASALPKPVVVALATDLIFATKIASTARSLGVQVHIARDQASLLAQVSTNRPSTVLIDLNAEGRDPVEAIRELRRLDHPPGIVAYLSHVQTELAKAARDAGADEVLARSTFSTKLAEILSRSMQRSTAGPI